MTTSAAPLVIRVATPADQAIVVALLDELVEELGPLDSAAEVRARLPGDIAAALVSPRVRIFLAEQAGGAIGLSRADVLTEDPIFRLRADQRCGYVDQMFVRRPQRGAGVGRQLLASCEAWFRELGITYSLLHAAPRAVQFYERAGYLPNREMFKRL